MDVKKKLLNWKVSTGMSYQNMADELNDIIEREKLNCRKVSRALIENWTKVNNPKSTNHITAISILTKGKIGLCDYGIVLPAKKSMQNSRKEQGKNCKNNDYSGNIC
jgi:hypothetical protein